MSFIDIYNPNGLSMWHKQSSIWATAVLGFIILIGMLSPWIVGASGWIPYEPTDLDTAAKLLPPGSHQHILGTDILGRDVAAGLIRGTTKSMWIGGLTTALAAIVGIYLGMIAGYLGDRGWKVTLLGLILGMMTALVATWYGYYELLVFRQWPIVFVILWAMTMWLIIMGMTAFKGEKTISIPVDSILLRCIEVRKSIPTMIFILALLPLFLVPSMWNIIIIIGLLLSIEFARIARAETLNIKAEAYVQRASLSGFPITYILKKYIWPNAQATLIVAICFAVSGAILIESSLSFLGLGLSIEEVSWGSLMSEGRKTNTWWLVLLPGLMIFAVVWSLNTLAFNMRYTEEEKK
jgi:peptide/nickel transport system permease protein